MGTTSSSEGLRLRRVKKAYEQIADQFRELILVGEWKPGRRLPTEQELASELGVSRATVREALRVLATQGLVRTAKGSGGGSYVTQPSVEVLSSLLETSISLLGQSQELSLEEFLEAREVLEVPAARLAAARRSDSDLRRIAAAIPEAPDTIGTGEQFVLNRDFHSTIIDICSNALLTLAARPIFVVLQTRLARSTLDDGVHSTINRHHREVARAIEEADVEAAGERMAEHLAWLRPVYRRVWLQPLGGRPGML